MGNKKFIFSADDFGINNTINRGVLDGYNAGVITSASLCANGSEFNAAVNEILPYCPGLKINVHLNISYGKALSGSSFITDNRNRLNNTFLTLCSMAANPKGLNAIEKEFRAQIEKITEYKNIDCINSRGNIHCIPAIFKLTCKLAADYNIPYIRLQHEEILLSKNLGKISKAGFTVNLIKTLLLNSFAGENRRAAEKYGIKTTDYTIGTLYRGCMDAEIIEEYLQDTPANCVIECFAIPDKQKRPAEYELCKNKLLADKIFRAGFDLTNYNNLK